MQPPFKLFGAELSPYSIKVRAYLRYKGLAHAWTPRSQATQAEFQRYAKLPLIPVLVDANDVAHQDSTPIIERLEAAHAEPSILPPDDVTRFLAALLEDYADEWVNKAMFHYRWTYEADQISAAERIVDTMLEGMEGVDRAAIAATVRERMIGRLHHVGSSAETAPVIEASFLRLIELLDLHLAGRRYLFGGRPTIADFGLAAQLAELLSDPTPGAIMRARAGRVVAWIERTMDAPDAQGDFEPFDAMRSTMAALLKLEIAGAFLPWMAANADAMFDGAETLELDINGAPFKQTPQKYAVRAYGELKRKRAAIDSAALTALLEEVGAARYLPAPEAAREDGDEVDEPDMESADAPEENKES